MNEDGEKCVGVSIGHEDDVVVVEDKSGKEKGGRRDMAGMFFCVS